MAADVAMSTNTLETRGALSQARRHLGLGSRCEGEPRRAHEALSEFV